MAEIARSADNRGTAALKFAMPSLAGIRDCLVKIILNVFPASIDELRSLNQRNVYFSRKNVNEFIDTQFHTRCMIIIMSNVCSPHFDAYLTAPSRIMIDTISVSYSVLLTQILES